MKRIYPIIGRVLLLAVLAALPVQALAARPHPIKVLTCNPSRGSAFAPGYVPAYYPVGPYYWADVYGQRYYQVPLHSNPSLGIDYVNQTQIVIKEIEFGLVAKGSLVAEVRDVGTFSPGVEIRHEFGISPNVFPLGTGLAQCVPLRIRFEDGTTWENPHLPALRRSIYRRP
ncbi:MAG TPA: hypothetical protein VMW12_13810 [Candidatus Dormibacteraeota bacterium]|nr:hypothetical protein [Candidatus Dormibacteraeota bacterium]